MNVTVKKSYKDAEKGWVSPGDEFETSNERGHYLMSIRLVDEKKEAKPRRMTKEEKSLRTTKAKTL